MACGPAEGTTSKINHNSTNARLASVPANKHVFIVNSGSALHVAIVKQAPEALGASDAL